MQPVTWCLSLLCAPKWYPFFNSCFDLFIMKNGGGFGQLNGFGDNGKLQPCAHGVVCKRYQETLLHIKQGQWELRRSQVFWNSVSIKEHFYSHEWGNVNRANIILFSKHGHKSPGIHMSGQRRNSPCPSQQALHGMKGHHSISLVCNSLAVLFSE